MKYTCLICSLLLPIFLFSQTSLGGQINTYGLLVSQDACTNTLLIENASDFTPGMGLIILQMNGANIDLSNTDNYGNITDLNGAGQYEYNRINSITGNEISLEFALINEYSGNNTQVIGFQIYQDASVDNTLEPALWDGATGGVLAIEVTGTLTINADIDASGHGFRGGVPFSIEDNNCNFLTNANDFAYADNNWRGAPKGEGIGVANSSEPFGRGAQANGGGGGNDHNSGGGGGSLVTAGGQGGRNNEPSTFGCDGDFPGRGGKTLLNDSSLAFLGGGGGSGHANNNTLSGGGNGGGIIFIKAEAINFAGGRILNNGINANNISGDGGGGGGAGGSIFVLTNSISGEVQIMAQGGTGSTVNNSNADRCFGPGGGGSGGNITSNISLLADLAGGNAGLSTNSNSCGESSNGAENGTDGLSTSINTLPQGELFAAPTLVALTGDTTVCNGTLLTLIALSSGSNYNLQWQRLVDETWSDLVEVPGVLTGTQTDSLHIQANETFTGSYRLTLIPEGDCFAEINTTAIDVTILPFPAGNPSYLTNGNDVSFSANTINGSSWSWSFLTGQNSTEENPSFTFPESGEYPVTLSIANECGSTSYDLVVSISEPLVAQISSSSIEGCAPLVVLFEDQSTGSIENRVWTFPGGTPATSTAAAPVVTFMEPGIYTVDLSISNSTSSANSNQQITVVIPPTPSFEIITDGLMISLQNNSLNATNFSWNFGDENTSTLENPVHIYSTPGVYEVSLSASNNYCGVAIAQTINVNVSAASNPNSFPLIISPNPTSGWVDVQNWQSGELVLIDHTGRYLTTWKSIPNRIDMSTFPAGLYFLRYTDGTQYYWFRIIKQ